MILLAQTDIVIGVYQTYGLVGGTIIIVALIVIRIMWVQINIQKTNAEMEVKRDLQYIDMVEQLREQNRTLESNYQAMIERQQQNETLFKQLEKDYQDCLDAVKIETT